MNKSIFEIIPGLEQELSTVIADSLKNKTKIDIIDTFAVRVLSQCGFIEFGFDKQFYLSSPRFIKLLTEVINCNEQEFYAPSHQEFSLWNLPTHSVALIVDRVKQNYLECLE